MGTITPTPPDKCKTIDHVTLVGTIGTYPGLGCRKSFTILVANSKHDGATYRA